MTLGIFEDDCEKMNTTEEVFSSPGFLLIDKEKFLDYYYVMRYIVIHNNKERDNVSYSGGTMTEAMYYILLALVNPNHGYQLMAAIEQVSNGRIKMGPGTLYGVLTRLQKDNLIEILSDDGRRKTYAITEEGRAALKVEYERLKDMIQDGRILEG